MSDDQEAGQQTGKPLPRRKWTPLFFPTYASRVRFVVILTVFLLAAGTVSASLALWSDYRAEAARAHDRAAAAVLEPIAAVPSSIREVLSTLDGATRSMAQCDRDLATAGSRLPFAVRLGITDRDGNVLCQTKGATGSLVGSKVIERVNSSMGFSVGDAPTPDAGRVLDFALPFLKGDRVTTVAFVTVDVARFASFRPAVGNVLGLADGRGFNLLRVARVSSSGAEQEWSDAPSGLVAAALERKSGSVIATDGDGVTRRYVFRALPGLGAGRLYAYTGADAAVIFGPADRPALAVGLLLSAFFIVIAGLVLAIGNYLVTRKTRQMVKSMHRILAGELDADALPRGLGELEEIIGLFVELVDKIDSAKNEVETQVKNRTSALSLSKGITELEKARLEALLASIGEGVVATDHEGKILFLNGTARAAMRWTADKVEGSLISDVFRLEDEKENLVDRSAWPIIEAMSTGKIVRTPAPVKPFYLRRTDRGRIPVRMTASPVILGKETLGALVVFADITSEVEFDQRKSDFISVASHQLRSPSSAVKFMADMMRKGDIGELTPKQKEWTDKLYLAADAMTDLVSELLNISRVETGVRFSFETQDPNAVVADAVKLMEAALMEKGQKLSFTPATLPPVTYDKFSLAEVIKNFVSNASKYSPHGSVITVTVSAQGQDATRFAVTDQGMGIPAADHDKMFSKFFRAGNAMKSPVPGTGLGLYYCKTVVEKHGGHIGFDSEEGKGTTFWFILPNAGPKV